MSLLVYARPYSSQLSLLPYINELRQRVRPVSLMNPCSLSSVKPSVETWAQALNICLPKFVKSELLCWPGRFHAVLWTLVTPVNPLPNERALPHILPMVFTVTQRIG